MAFTEDQRRQMRNVLRLHPGDMVAVFDGSGREYQTEITLLDQTQAAGKVLKSTTPDTEPRLRVTLIQGLPKGEKLELVLQKCTEIGVAEFLIVETERSVPHIPKDRLQSRLERWRSIVREAAEQSGRVRLPDVHGVIPFADALARVNKSVTNLIAWEKERDIFLSPDLPWLAGAREVSYFVGPEGGFTDEEIAKARLEGVIPVSLGPRTLRTETAAIVGAALMIYGTGA